VVDDAEAWERRIRQFEHYIGLMEHRTLRLVKSDCFLIFSHRAPTRIRPRLGSEDRFVQFAFESEGFLLDLPDTTLTHEEAKRLVTERPGFQFILGDASRKRADNERVFDPIQRTYRYGEQRIAAEDAAYLFFTLWEFPLGTWIKVQAQSFEGDRHWERGFSLG
jgi:hypothetical protein